MVIMFRVMTEKNIINFSFLGGLESFEESHSNTIEVH